MNQRQNAIIIFLLLLLAQNSNAGEFNWTDWTSFDSANALAAGVIAGGSPNAVSIEYSGNPSSAQLGAPADINYWQPPAIYRAGIVGNQPGNSDLVILDGIAPKTQRLRFSRPIKDPVLAFTSLGATTAPVVWRFNSAFEVLSSGPGTLEKTDTRELKGVEGNGLIRFEGVLTEITWTVTGSDTLQGFTVGASDLYMKTPQVVASYINRGSGQRSMIQGIGLTFDRDVKDFLKTKHLKIRNITTGQLVNMATANLVYDPRNFSATWLLSKKPEALLPDGNYLAWLETKRLTDDEPADSTLTGTEYVWVDWTVAQWEEEWAKGRFFLTGIPAIDVDYTGEINFAQTGDDRVNFWANDEAYKSSFVSNAPATSDIITLTGQSQMTQRIRFSRPVKDPIMAILSLGQDGTRAIYKFDQPFEVLSWGVGAYGRGPFKALDYNRLFGEEGHGVIRFEGTFNEIVWTVEEPEMFHGFSIGLNKQVLLNEAISSPIHVNAAFAAQRMPVDDFTFGFHQLSGDTDGDRDVDFLDTFHWRETWQKDSSQPAFKSQFDFNLDDSVAEHDKSRLALTYFTTLPEVPALHACLRADTGDSSIDRRTSLYDVAVGIVNRQGFSKLAVKLDGGRLADITTSIIGENKAILQASAIDALSGSSLSVGIHRLEFQAQKQDGTILATDVLDFEYLGDVNNPPYFTSTPPSAILATDYIGGTANDILFTLPGPPGAPVDATFRWTIRDAAYNNEFGIYAVDDPNGTVQGLSVTSQGYIESALSVTNSQMVFSTSQGAGAVSTLRLKAGQIYSFYLIQNSSSDIFRANNPSNNGFLSPHAFLAYKEANNDGLDHLIATPLPSGKTQFAWEDLSGVGNQNDPNNFKDVVFEIDYELLSGGRLPLVYNAIAVDPEGDALTYRLVANPDGTPIPDNATIDQTSGRFAWIPATSGTYSFTIEATDSHNKVGQQSFSVKVHEHDLPPSVRIFASSGFPTINEVMTLQVVGTDDIGISSQHLYIDGTEVPLNAQGYYTTTFTSKGPRQLTAKVTDNRSQAAESNLQLVVIDPNSPDNANGRIGTGNGPAPKVTITSPTSDSTVEYLTEIRGSVDPNGGTIREWALEYAPADRVNLQDLAFGSWTRISSGTTAQADSVLGTLDTTKLRNDSYVVRLLAYNTNGAGYVIPAVYHVSGQAKLGNFRLDFTDLQIPLAGIPITITRSYDTLNAGHKGDFGFGWSLGTQDGDLRETTPGVGGLFSANPYRKGTRVYVTMPEGRRIGFTFEPEFAMGSLFGSLYRAKFVPDPGVYEKLTTPEGGQAFLSIASDGSARIFLFGLGWNPDEFTVTRTDGTRFDYTQSDGLKNATTPNGNALTYTRDGITHTSGASIRFIRDAQGRITEIRDPAGKSILYTYNPAGNLTTVKDREGAETKFTYLTSPAHYLEDVIDPLGRRAQRTEYGPDGRVTAVIDALGNRVEQSFDPSSFTGTRTDARGNVTTLVYNARGNLVEERKPEGGITRWEYNDPANPDKETAKIDPLNHRTTYTWDTAGNKATETDPLGMVTSYTYSSLNKITSLTRASADGTLQTSESAHYDATGNLTRLIDGMGNHRDFVYGVDGRLLSSTDFEGNVTEYDYTSGCPCGSPSKILYPDGTTKLLEYNHLGQVSKVTDETGAITRFSYNSNGLKTAETDHDGNTTRLEYDANGNLTKRIDRLGRIAKFIYNEKNDLTREIKLLTNDGDDTNDVVLNYEYDADKHLTALIDPENNRTEFFFDRDGRMTRRKDAAGAITTVVYDLAGNTKEIINRNGQKRSFLYDEANHPTAERWHNTDDSIIRTIAITYDGLHRRKSISDPNSSYTWKYDANHRVTEESNAGTPNLPTVVLKYGYNKDGRQTSTTDNAGVSVTTSFDSRGLSNHFIWSGGGIAPASVDLDRNGRGQITSIKRYRDATLTNMVSRTTYDQIAPQGWVKQIQHRGPTDTLYDPGSNFTYGYNAEGEVTSQSSQGNSTIYAYNQLGELTSADHTSPIFPDEYYVYSKGGNRVNSHLHASYTTGIANRLLSDGVYNYVYDAEGNLVTQTEILTGKITQFVYDYRGRVTSIVERSASDGQVVNQQNFVFDVLDRRITIDAEISVTNIVYNGDNAWADFNSDGTVVAKYLFADRIDGNLAKWTFAAGTQWYISDNLGSIRSISSAGGNLMSHMSYDTFGKPNFDPASFRNDRFGFTGRESATDEMVYSRARLYASGYGRFIVEDRHDFLGADWNLYRYALNSPLLYTDPTGHSSVLEGAILSSITGAVVGAGGTLYCTILRGKELDPVDLIFSGLGGAVAGLFAGPAVALSPFIATTGTIGGTAYIAILVCSPKPSH